MEPSADVAQLVGSNGFDSADTSSGAIGNECVKVLNEVQAAVETENQENQCQMKPVPLEIATDNEGKVEVNDDIRGNDGEITSFPTKDTNEVKAQNAEKSTVEVLMKEDEVSTVREEAGKNEIIAVLKKEETSTVEDVAEKIATSSVKDVVEKNEASTTGVVVEENKAPTVDDGLSTNETVTAKDVGGKEEEAANIEGVLGKDEGEGEVSPCSQEDMFASEPPSPGIIPCSIGNTVPTEVTEECTKDEKMEVDNTADLVGEGRASKRQHVESDDECPEMKKSSDAERNLPKRARHSVEIVFECPKSQEAQDLPVPSSMNRSEELDLTGGTEESIHLHYSPSPEYDIPETQFEPDLNPRAPSLTTVVIGSDDEDAETTDKPVATAPVTECATSCLAVNPGNEDTLDVSVPKSQGPDNNDNSLTETCTVVDSKASSDVEAPVHRCPSPPKETTLLAKDDGSTSLPHRSSSPSQQKSTQCFRPPTQEISSARVLVTSSPYADIIPVPHYESLCSSVERQTPSPTSCSQHNTSSSKCPTSKTENTDRVVEVTKDVLLHAQVVLHYREASKEVIFYELTQCDVAEGMTHSTTTETSSGTPMLDSKNTSPGSVTSVGPFPLVLRASTTSSSSSSSLTSAAHLALSNASKRLRTGVEVLNLDLVASAIRKIGPEQLPVPSAMFAGHRLRTTAPPSTSNKTTDTADDLKKEDVDTKETVGTDRTVTTPLTSEKNQRNTTRKRGRARGGSSRGRSSARGQARTQPSPLSSEPLTWGTEDASRFKGMLHPGASAFARWTDKRYYSAKLSEKQRDGRWLVAFDDGSVKTVKEDFVIPVETLTKGTLVYATLPDGSCADGIVSALFVQDNEEQYGVELDDREVIVPRRDIFLTEDQARLLLEGATVTLPAPSTPGRLADVDLNNVVAGKRLRTPTHAASGPATPRTPGPSGNACPNKVSRSSSPSDRGSVSGATTDDAVSVVGVEPEGEGCKLVPVATSSSRGKGKVSAKGKGKALFATTNILKESTELDETLGPIPPKDSKIFEGMIFLLTSVDFEPNKSYEKVHEICSDSEGEREFSSYRFVKDRLRMQLEAGGGTVLESLDDVPEDRLRDTILIANRPCLTAKYICCLAKAVKIINHEFVIQRTKGDMCSPNAYGLPLGWSLLDERYVGNGIDLGAVQRTRKGGSRQLLSRKKLVLVHETPQFLAFWQKVLNDLGAKTTTYSPNDATKADAELKSSDAIISDASCPPQIQERAREWHKPLISTTWITQCLINREVLAFDALPNFKYDFSD
ncbi:TP53-binding protein 1-like isoform X1 [Schistocerca gregaria]|uniref:TP53-binding protein 1-like isoform X1 n=1 Tax=Schistocerca gregaria TaxID=7010 RepID=UPI00211DEAC7|nr:TP53-binding protein 1-like isoform X1 [Schistocerca gregaria]